MGDVHTLWTADKEIGGSADTLGAQGARGRVLVTPDPSDHLTPLAKEVVMAMLPCAPDPAPRRVRTPDQVEQHRKYVKRWHVDRRRGIDRSPIDPARVRTYLQPLLDEGWSVRAIAKAAGTSDTALRDLVAGRTSSVRRAIAARLLSVTRAKLYDGADAEVRVPAHGFVRRVQAMQSLGYPTRWLEANGVDPDIGPAGKGVDAARWRRCRDLYEQVWDKQGPSARARAIAARKGYAPPMAWDDIDDPTCQPDVGQEPRGSWDADDVAWLLTCGETQVGIAARFGIRVDSLQRGLRRAGRDDLVARLVATLEAS